MTRVRVQFIIFSKKFYSKALKNEYKNINLTMTVLKMCSLLKKKWHS